MMKKFIFILDQSNELIEVARIGSKRYNFLQKHFPSDSGSEKKITFAPDFLRSLIDEQLRIRGRKASETTNFGGRFSEEEVSIEIPFDGALIKLKQVAEDNFLIFLLNIYNVVVQNGQEMTLLAAGSHKELREFLAGDNA